MVSTIPPTRKKGFATLTLPERRIRFDQADRNLLLPDVVRLGRNGFWERWLGRSHFVRVAEELVNKFEAFLPR